MASAESKSIAVLGAGVTGLTAAYRLTRLGHRVKIFEQTGRAGGAVRTERSGGWLIEAGPNSLLSGETAMTGLLGELGLNEQIIPANTSARHRYVVRAGRLIAAPLSPPAFLASGLFSPIAKLRILSELVTRPRIRTTDVPLSEFVRGHFGDEFVDYALNPFVVGVYAGDPGKLSARYAFPKLWQLERTHGSLLRGQIAQAKARKSRHESPSQIFSFAEGLQTLIDAIVQCLPNGCIAFNTSLEALTPGERWNIIWNEAGAAHTQAFDAVVVALPAHALARLRLGSLGERPLAALDAVEHPPVSSLFLGYRREHVEHPLNGFGVLIPAAEKLSTLGVLFSSSLFPQRAPEGHVALTVMIGGTRQPELASLSTGQLLARVRGDLQKLLGVTGEPAFVRHTFWPRAIPQYNLGHEQHIASMTLLERSQPGLFIGGQARDGVSLPSCIAAGEKLAARANK